MPLPWPPFLVGLRAPEPNDEPIGRQAEIAVIKPHNVARRNLPANPKSSTAYSRHGGERAAAVYSLLGSAKLNGIDPEAYMTELLRRIADHPINRIEELLSWRLFPVDPAEVEAA